jgi:hypothetical protein
MVVAPTNPPPTAVSSNNGMMNLGIYSIISAVYLIINHASDSLSSDKPEGEAPASPASPSFFTITKIMSIIFLAIIWLTQFMLTFMSLQQQCNTPNYGLAAWSSFATFALLFVPLFVCLEYNFEWLRPFGNTFGYLINKLNGLVSFMHNILRPKSDSGDKVQKYLDYMNEDPWALFSMLTAYDDAPKAINASKKFDDLKDSGYLNGTLPDGAKETFVNFVRVKENIAKFVFYVLTLNFMADLTFIIAQENSPCAINIDEVNDAAAFKPKSKSAAATKPPVVFKTSE